jgi:hypothetical protein
MLVILVTNAKHQVCHILSSIIPIPPPQGKPWTSWLNSLEFMLCVWVCVCVCFCIQTRRSAMRHIFQRRSIIKVHNLTPDLLNTKHGVVSAAMSVRKTAAILVDKS